MVIKIDWDLLLLTDGKVIVDLKNPLGWAFINGRQIPDQIRMYVEQAYRKAIKIGLNEPCPAVNLAWSSMVPTAKQANDLYFRFLDENWVLTSSGGTQYQYDRKTGELKQLTWVTRILNKIFK